MNKYSPFFISKEMIKDSTFDITRLISDELNKKIDINRINGDTSGTSGSDFEQYHHPYEVREILTREAAERKLARDM